MKNDKNLIDRVDELVASLDNGPPDEQALSLLRALLVDAKAQQADLTLLRSDLMARIAGMAKAMAVACRSESRLAEVTDMVDELRSLDAAGLIAAYRKTSARFRDTFRSSFDPNGVRPARSKARPSDVRDYK